MCARDSMQNVATATATATTNNGQKKTSEKIVGVREFALVRTQCFMDARETTGYRSLPSRFSHVHYHVSIVHVHD